MVSGNHPKYYKENHGIILGFLRPCERGKLARSFLFGLGKLVIFLDSPETIMLEAYLSIKPLKDFSKSEFIFCVLLKSWYSDLAFSFAALEVTLPYPSTISYSWKVKKRSILWASCCMV